MKTAAVLNEGGAFALLFRPHGLAFGSSSVAAPRKFAIHGKKKKKKSANARGLAQEEVDHGRRTDALF